MFAATLKRAQGLKRLQKYFCNGIEYRIEPSYLNASRWRATRNLATPRPGSATS